MLTFVLLLVEDATHVSVRWDVSKLNFFLVSYPLQEAG